jgi:hypothetical protein
MIPELKAEFLKKFPELYKLKNWWNLLKSVKYKKRKL